MRSHTGALTLVSLAATLSGQPASAYDVNVGVDLWHEATSSFDVGPENDAIYDPGALGSARLRAGFETRLGGPKLRLIGEADFFAHRLYGEPTELGTYAVDPRLRRAEVFHPFPILPRKLYVEWAPFFGVIRAGQQASHWGLGLVANGGERSDKLFGESYRGSLSERVLFATSPFQALGALPDSVLGRFTLLAAADLVLADETALLLDTGLRKEDVARQLVFSTLLRPRTFKAPATAPRSALNGGVYAVRRSVDATLGDELDVWVVDGHVRFLTEWERFNSIRWELEVAIVDGETDRFVTEQGRDGVKVRSMGFAAEIDWRFAADGLPITLGLRAGAATGDGDPDDDEVGRFTFNGDYDVGQILFDQIVPALQRRSTERVDNPLRSKSPPQGYEHFAGRGGVSGASYAALRTVVEPTDALDVGVEVMTASTTVPFTDPYSTFAQGGGPRNAFGGRGEGRLGMEVAAAARYALTMRDPELVPALRLTYSAFFPGAALEGPDGGLGTVHFGQVKLSIDSHLLGGG